MFLPGESQAQGSLVGCHLWGHTELDMTEATSQHQLGKQCPYLGRVTHGRVGVWERAGRLGAESLLFALSLQST